MSWETFIVGNFELVKDISEKQKDKALKELEDVLETKIEYDEEHEYFIFEDVSWNSHVAGETVSKVVKKYNHLLKYFEMSLFYLTDPDEEISLSDTGNDVEITTP